jgi:hypothetical protein
MSAVGRNSTALLPPQREYVHRQPLKATFDSSTNQTRVSLNTHKGMYFLWVQHPRVSFFYDYPGITVLETPNSVFMVFRTVDPQMPADNHLTIVCADARYPQDIAPTFWFEPGPVVGANRFTYEIPIDLFAAFVRCEAPAVEVGDIRVHFNQEQTDALRDFASRMAPTR